MSSGRALFYLSKQSHLQVFISDTCQKPSEFDCLHSLINPIKVELSKSKSEWLYVTFKSMFDTSVDIRFITKKLKSVTREEPPIVDPSNFTLGKGTWTVKKARVEKLVSLVVDDKLLQKRYAIKRVSSIAISRNVE